jgi:hydrogenase maturation protease
VCGQSAIVVIGLGNEYRHDDGVGLYVARSIRAMAPDEVAVVEGAADSAQLALAIADRDIAYIVDAATSGTQPAGYIHCYSALRGATPEEVLSGKTSHNVSVNEALFLVDLIGRRPLGVFVYGIEGADFSQGIGLCDEVKKAGDSVIDTIVNLIRRESPLSRSQA